MSNKVTVSDVKINTDHVKGKSSDEVKAMGIFAHLDEKTQADAFSELQAAIAPKVKTPVEKPAAKK